MLKGLLLCAAACAAPMTAVAGERDLPIIPDIKALLAADGSVRLAPGRRVVAPHPATFLPIAYRGVERVEVHTLPATPLPQDELRSFSLIALKARPDWHLHLSPLLADLQTTSTRGGSWAVQDTLADYRKPRIPRSPLSTMLVLKIDGQEDSAPLSVGGGGVAAALWRAMPGN